MKSGDWNVNRVLFIALTVGQAYVSEITPTNMRGVALSAYTISMVWYIIEP